MEEQINKKEINGKVSNINCNDNKPKLLIYDKDEEKIIEKMSELLYDICKENTKDFKNDKNIYIKPFLSKTIPSISIIDYFWRLCKYSKINNSTKILILIYIDRLCNMYKFKLSFYNIHKLIFTSMLVAIKYNEDDFYSTKFYSKLGGISRTDVIILESTFLSLIDFNLFVSEELFKKYNDYISSAESDEDECEYDISYNDD